MVGIPVCPRLKKKREKKKEKGKRAKYGNQFLYWCLYVAVFVFVLMYVFCLFWFQSKRKKNWSVCIVKKGLTRGKLYGGLDYATIKVLQNKILSFRYLIDLIIFVYRRIPFTSLFDLPDLL